MKTRCFFLLLFFSPYFTIGQTLSGKVIDQSTNLPVSDASVFIENSSTGVITDANGNFNLTLLPNKKTVIISAFGYQFYILENPQPGNNVLIHLTADENQMEEMVIDKRFFTREELLKCFKTFFIGTTENAKKTVIKNEKDIYLYYDGATFKLTAWSDKPIKMVNNNLGYEIAFHLVEFEVKFRRLTIDAFDNEYSLLYGYTLFRDIADNKKRILKNRKEVYVNSSSNFFRSLAENKLSENNYLLYVNSLPIDCKEYFEIATNREGYELTILKKPIKPTINAVIKVDGINKQPVVTAPKEEEVPFHVMNTKTDQTSVLYTSGNQISIDKKGNLLQTNQVFFGGFFGQLKVADMLPIDYDY